jgi:hypothetical protein
MLVLAGLALRRRQRDKRPSLQRVLRRILGTESDAWPQQRIIASLAARGVAPELLAALRDHWQEEEESRFSPPGKPLPTSRRDNARRLARELGKAVDKRRRFP